MDGCLLYYELNIKQIKKGKGTKRQVDDRIEHSFVFLIVFPVLCDLSYSRL